jgi:hypothetical protein
VVNLARENEASDQAEKADEAEYCKDVAEDFKGGHAAVLWIELKALGNLAYEL